LKKSRSRNAATLSTAKKASARHWQVVAKVAVIILSVALSYWPALRAGFVWDDEPLVTANPLLRSLSGLGEIWTGSRTADYFPITNTVFWIEYHLFGPNASGYHALNILLQAANALLVWLVLRRLQIPGAFLAGLIFGMHPLHAESVAWISELKNVLSMFFFLLSALCFFRSEESGHLAGRLAYIASLIFFLLALLSKTQVVFLPVVLLLCAWWRSDVHAENKRRHFQTGMIRALPFFLIAFVLGLVTIWFQSRGIGEEEIVLGPWSRRLTNAGLAMWWYGKQVFLPIRLMAVYPSWRFDSPRIVDWMPLIALIIVVMGLWLWRNRYGRAVLFALACFIVALLPVVGLIRMAYARSGTIVADHLQYFADVALIALFSAGVARLWGSKHQILRILAGAVVVILCATMASYTWARGGVYENEQTLWQDNFSKNPNAWQGHNRLGELFFNQGDFVDAAKHFERAAALKPELADNYNWLGLALCRLERFEDGIAQYRKGLALKEGKSATAKTRSTATMRTNLANALALTANNLIDSAQVLSQKGEMVAADEAYKGAMTRYDEAIAQYETVLKINPEQPAVHRNLGILLARLGRNNEAIEHLRKVLQLVPNEPIAREALDELEKH
jgi:protein O-mannosyl-transferase